MSDDPLWAATVPDAPAREQREAVASASVGVATPGRPAATEVMPVVDGEPVGLEPADDTVPRDRSAPADVRPDDRRGDERWYRRRLGVRVLAALVLIGSGYFVVSLFQVWSTGRSYQARSVDAIVVLGAAQYDGRPSPQLQARLDEVLRLWPQGHAELVVVTGGKQPDDRFTEADASARYLVERGVPEHAIVYEDAGSTTFESLQATASILGERGLDRVLLVTDPFHSLRSRLIAEEVGLEAYVAPTSTSVVGGGRSAALHVKEAGGVALGRLVGFGRLSGLTG